MTKEISPKVQSILGTYNANAPDITADALRTYWLTFAPKSIAGIKAEQREMQETVGIPVPVLQAIGKEVAKFAKKYVEEFIPLTRLLWEKYGREGRVVTVYPLGAMELIDPEKLLPIIMKLCRASLPGKMQINFPCGPWNLLSAKTPKTGFPSWNPGWRMKINGFAALE